jgi:hypothetical protein
MQLEEALNLLKQVCASYRGTLQDHQSLQQALNIVESRCKFVPKVEDKKETVNEASVS